MGLSNYASLEGAEMNELRAELMTPAQRAKVAAAAGLAPPVDPAPGASDNETGPAGQQQADGEPGQVGNGDQRPQGGA